MSDRILWLPGDGVGPEVTAQAQRAVEAAAGLFGHRYDQSTALIGGSAIDAAGEPLPAATLAAARGSDAIFLGAVGGPKWDALAGRQRPEAGLLALRGELGLYANLRPIRPVPALASFSPIRAERLVGVDFVVVRELTGGIYFGERQEGDEQAYDVCSYSRSEIERVVQRAAEMALNRRRKLTLVDKANVLATSRLWRRVTEQLIAARYPQIELEILLVDAAAMHLLTRPADFDVIVTENLFGDILTDEAGVLCGSLGMLGSASLGDSGPGLFEPIHGSAPDIAGQGRANPVGALSSAVLMMRHSLGWSDAAEALDEAIQRCLQQQLGTCDIGGDLTTEAAGSAVINELRCIAKAA